MAIQVSGTTVIDNTPNLVNVGGLKTINGTSILGSGNISAGGSSTLITDQAAVSGSAGISVSLTGGYQKYIITIANVSVNGGSLSYGTIRFTNSSNTKITASGSYMYNFQYDGSYAQGKDSYGYTDFHFGNRSGTYEVIAHESSTDQTTVTFSYGAGRYGATNTGIRNYYTGSVWQPYGYEGVSNSIILFDGATVSDGYYSVWGVS